MAAEFIVWIGGVAALDGGRLDHRPTRIKT
jgi:hypothetical protein